MIEAGDIRTILEAGMSFSNGPMRVIPGQFGVRLEDHFYMGDGGRSDSPRRRTAWTIRSVRNESEILRFKACGLRGRSVYPPLAWKRAGRRVLKGIGRGGFGSFGFRVCGKAEKPG